jgi:hypothetical protein
MSERETPRTDETVRNTGTHSNFAPLIVALSRDLERENARLKDELAAEREAQRSLSVQLLEMLDKWQRTELGQAQAQDEAS